MVLLAKSKMTLSATMIAMAAMVMPVAPVSAAVPSAHSVVPGTPGPSLAPVVDTARAEAGVEVAQSRNARRNRHRNRAGRHYRRPPPARYGPRRGYRSGYNPGAAAAAGVIGLAAGAIAGSALANSQPDTVVIETGVPAPYTAEWYRQCDLKYRSFRASDGTFMGYDGVRKTCRLP